MKNLMRSLYLSLPIFALCPALLLSQTAGGNIQFGGSVSFAANLGPSVTANFLNRDNSTPVVAPGFLGVGGVGSTLSDTTAISLVGATGMNRTRLFAKVDQIFASGTASFTAFDAQITRALNGGFTPFPMVLSGTPPSLGASACTPPSNATTWASDAAAIVAHLDATFPGVITEYEIWNEPDAQASLCSGTTAANLTAYLSLYAAAGSAIRAQDATVHIGGPALSAPANNASWITSLTTNASTFPFVDFVSLHIYVTGQFDINAGMDWPFLYTRNQSSTQGLVHYYQSIESLVRSGSQANAATTPVYITEYADNNAFSLDCCRSDANFGPLYNSTSIAALLNTAYSGDAKLPTNIEYFAVTSSLKFFCLVGQINAQMDCSGVAPIVAYPQYYAYQLFASPSFLGLEAGAHMAASVTPLPPANTTLGFGATAFYTATKNNIVIVNPSAVSFAAVPVTMNNAALSSATGTSYTLNAANSTITSAPATLTPIAGGYSAQIAVPAFSTVALSIVGSAQVATPTFSTSGAVSPGTMVTLSDATSGAAIDYTWDSTTPTYDPTFLFPTGTAMEYRAVDYASGFPIYTTMTVKAIAHKAGMTDSAVATATFSLTAPTGTSLTACGSLGSGTYFLANDVSSTGTCFNLTGSPVTIDLNGHTATYGTGGAKLATGTAGVTVAGSSTFSDPTANFIGIPVNSRIFIDDNNGFLLMTSSVSSVTDATHIVMSSAMKPAFPADSGFNTTTATWYIVPQFPTYGIACTSAPVFNTCHNTTVYNGSIVSSTNAIWGSDAIHMDGNNSPTIVAGVNITNNAPQSSAININFGSRNNLIQFNTIHDNVVDIYNRDQLPYPILDAGSSSLAFSTPADNIKDNQILSSPQGGIAMFDSGNVINNYGTLGNTIHYVNGYMVIALQYGITIRGNYVTGNMRGFDLEASSVANPTIFEKNVTDTQDSNTVHDPTHNGIGTEIDGNYAVRVKPIHPEISGSLGGLVINNNWLTTTAGIAPAQALRFTSPEQSASTSVTNNVVTLKVSTSQTGAIYPSSVLSVAGDGSNLPPIGGDMTNVTYSGNTFTRTGAFASTANDMYIFFDGIANWSLSGLSSPKMEMDAGGANNSSFTFTGGGTMTMHCSGGHATMTGTYNGTAVPCT